MAVATDILHGVILVISPGAITRLAKVFAVVKLEEGPVAAAEDVVYLGAHLVFFFSSRFPCGCFVRWDVGG